MEEFFGGLTAGILIAFIIGMFSYMAANDTMKKQAIAADVACYKVSTEGISTFTWNCKK